MPRASPGLAHEQRDLGTAHELHPGEPLSAPALESLSKALFADFLGVGSWGLGKPDSLHLAREYPNSKGSPLNPAIRVFPFETKEQW